MINTTYILTWIAGARPPVHPNPMQGKQGFESPEAAYLFFKKQPADAQFVSLKEITTIEKDCSYTIQLHMELDVALGI